MELWGEFFLEKCPFRKAAGAGPLPLPLPKAVAFMEALSQPLGDASECKSHITMMWLFCVPAYEPREAKRAVFPA